ncbi:MAG: Lpg1974 family pore-forming outer membrane protein [Candidatus Rhabdochlamydia sp.]
MKPLLCTSLLFTQALVHATPSEETVTYSHSSFEKCAADQSPAVSLIHVKTSQDQAVSQGQKGIKASQVTPDSSQDLPIQFSAQFLYLRAIEEGLDYGLLSPVQVPSGENTFLTGGAWGSISRIQPGFHGGYRLAASYAPSAGKLEATVQWMHYQHTSLSTLSVLTPAIPPAQPTDLIWPTLPLQWGIPNSQAASASWSLKMDIIDATFGAQWSAAKVVTVKPFAGFRTANIRQNLSATYTQVYLNTGATQDGEGNTVYNPTYNQMTPAANWKNQGYGIVGGLNTQFALGKGFSFFCQGTGSLLMGRVKPVLTQEVQGIAVNSVLPAPVQNVNVSSSQFVTTPVFEGAAGIGYEYDWNRVGMGLQLGWEEQYWGNQNFMTKFLGNSGSGLMLNESKSLSLGGYTVKATLKF